MIEVLLAVLALAGPPRATLEGTPLALSAWCWGGKCGAPDAVAPRPVRVGRGATVTAAFAFVPTEVKATVAGRRIRATVRGTEATWRVAAGGGVTITARSRRGFVVYVGRLAVR